MTLPPVSHSSLKGGVGWGEEVLICFRWGPAYFSTNPLTPTLSPLGRGEGAGTPKFGCVSSD
jgi:hypothetical protein